MADERDAVARGHPERRGGARGNGVSGAVYGLGVVGAAVYYIQHATTFWTGVVGFFKALVWPALLIYRVLALMKM